MAVSAAGEAPPSTDEPTGDPPAMKDPERWIACLRIGIGLWFLKSLWTKIGIGWVGPLVIPSATERWTGFLPIRIAEWAEVHPWGAYRAFLEGVVVPHAELFANLTAFSESLVGLLLVLGLLTGWAALGGVFLMLNYLLASLGTGLNQQGFHLLLIFCLVMLLAVRSGRRWGMDSALLARREKLLLA